MNIIVVGGGKMGLPLACVFAEKGAKVTVCDTNADLVAKINTGIAPHLEPELNYRLTKAVETGHLTATEDTTTAVRNAQVIVIIVSALLTQERDIDYSNLDAASEAVAHGLQKGTLVSYETTLPVGGCRNHLCPILEKSGLNVGKDFQLVFSPERIKSRNIFEQLSNTPKVVGGHNEIAAQAGEEFYRRYLDVEVINVGTLEAAEFVKLAGMVYRDVNIALVNELSIFAETMHINIGAVLEAANTDGETYMLRPSIGVGGHCTPVYPYFLIKGSQRVGVQQELVSIGRRINEKQPIRHVVRLKAVLGSLIGCRVHILGLAFRPSIRENSFSPAFALRDALRYEEACITIEDPLYSAKELTTYGFEPAIVNETSLDAVILNTAHPEYAQPDFQRWRTNGVRVIVDGQNFWPRAKIEKVGIIYIGIGQATTSL
jgi:nucleotide sugar dehydrogenase